MSLQTKNNISQVQNEIHSTLKVGGVLLIVMTFIFNVFSLSLPLYRLHIFDRVLSSKSSDTLFMLLVLIIICIIAMSLMDILRRKVPYLMINKLLICLDESALLENSTNKQNNITDLSIYQVIKTFSDKLNQSTLFTILDVLFAPLFLVITYFIHPTFFLYLLCINCLLFILSIIKYRNLSIFNQQSNSQDKINHLTQKQDLQNFYKRIKQ